MSITKYVRAVTGSNMQETQHTNPPYA